MPGEQHLLDCPVCGKRPELHSLHLTDKIEAYWYECPGRWWWFGKHLRGNFYVMQQGPCLLDYAKEMWNKVVRMYNGIC